MDSGAFLLFCFLFSCKVVTGWLTVSSFCSLGEHQEPINVKYGCFIPAGPDRCAELSLETHR